MAHYDDGNLGRKCRLQLPRLPLLSQAVRRRNFFPFPILWFSLVALEISVLADPRIAEQDIWFHLRNAQELLTRHSFLRADLYTFTAAGAPLMNFRMAFRIAILFCFSGLGYARFAVGVPGDFVARLRRGVFPGGAAGCERE